MIDPDLREKIGIQSDSNFLLNPHFAKYHDHIKFDLKHRKTRKNDYKVNEICYSSDVEFELIEDAINHIQANKKPLTSNNILILTHPFYMSLIHYQHITKYLEEDYDFYINNLMNLIRGEKDLDIIVFETAQHYSTITSQLLEQGLVNDVLLTEYDYGHLIKSSDLKYGKENNIDNNIINISNYNIYHAGGYENACLTGVIEEVQEATSKNIHEMNYITDLILPKPKSRNKSLKLKGLIIDDDYQISDYEDCIISLEKFYQIINIDAEIINKPVFVLWQ